MTTKTTISQDDARDLLLITVERNANHRIGTPGATTGLPGSTDGVEFITAGAMVTKADRVEVVRKSVETELWLVRSGYGTTVLYLHDDAVADLDTWRKQKAEDAARGAAILAKLAAEPEEALPF